MTVSSWTRWSDRPAASTKRYEPTRAPPPVNAQSIRQSRSRARAFQLAGQSERQTPIASRSEPCAPRVPRIRRMSPMAALVLKSPVTRTGCGLSRRSATSAVYSRSRAAARRRMSRRKAGRSGFITVSCTGMWTLYVDRIPSPIRRSTRSEQAPTGTGGPTGGNRDSVTELLSTARWCSGNAARIRSSSSMSQTSPPSKPFRYSWRT